MKDQDLTDKYAGLILNELHITLLLLGKLNINTKADLTKSLECLKESLDILKDEPQNTFPNKIYLSAKASVNDVEIFIKSLLK